MTIVVEAYQVQAGDVLVELDGEPVVDQVALWDRSYSCWLFAYNLEIVGRVPEGTSVRVARRGARLIPDSALMDACDPAGIPRPLHQVQR